MKHFRKVWTAEINEWLKTTKGMTAKDAYSAFLKQFPAVTDVSYLAFKNQRSRVGASAEYKGNHVSRKPKPLMSEHFKKGYVRIKVAQPNVWMMKQKYIYMINHPEEDLTERSNYVFLDGNNRNFASENIARVELKYMGLLNKLGGCVKGQPEIMRLRIAEAKLKYATMDVAEKLGLTTRSAHGGRVILEERNRKAREYQRSRREYQNEKARKYRARLKAEKPEKYEEILRKHREYMKIYNRGNAWKKKTEVE